MTATATATNATATPAAPAINIVNVAGKFVGLVQEGPDAFRVVCTPAGSAAWFLSPATASAKLANEKREWRLSPPVPHAQLLVALANAEVKLLDRTAASAAGLLNKQAREGHLRLVTPATPAPVAATPAPAAAAPAPVAPAPVAPAPAAPVAAPRMAAGEVLEAVRLGIMTPAEGRAAMGLPPLAAPVAAAPAVEATPVVAAPVEAAPVVEATPATEVASSPLPEGDNVAF